MNQNAGAEPVKGDALAAPGKGSTAFLPKVVFTEMESLLPGGDRELLQKACRLLEKGLYGNGQISGQEADFVIRCMDEGVKKLKRVNGMEGKKRKKVESTP